MEALKRVQSKKENTEGQLVTILKGAILYGLKSQPALFRPDPQVSQQSQQGRGVSASVATPKAREDEPSKGSNLFDLLARTEVEEEEVPEEEEEVATEGDDVIENEGGAASILTQRRTGGGQQRNKNNTKSKKRRRRR